MAHGMRLTDFKVLSFSCYGTLIDRESGIYNTLRPLLDSGGVKRERDEVLAAFKRHEAEQQLETPGMLYSEILMEVHRRLARQWHVPASDDEHELFGKSVPYWPIFAEAPAALQYLKRYYKLVILSNVDRESFAGSMRRFEVGFDAVFTAQDIGTHKPDPRNFEYMLKKLAQEGLSKREILHTSASLTRDLDSAAELGLASAWICRRPGKAGSAPASAARSGTHHDFRFFSLADMVRFHHEQL